MRLPAYDSAIGRWIRLPLGIVPQERPQRILTGPLKGRRWIPAAHVHSCWMGWYGALEQRYFRQLVHPGSVVYDIGACVGFFSLLGARLAGPTGRVIAVEPMPRNVRYLRQHLRLNECENVRLVEAAVADHPHVAYFSTSRSVAENGLDDTGDLRVEVCTIDQLSADDRPPTLIKLDVEGAEALALQGAATTLVRHRPHILLSLHTDEGRRESLKLLREAGYVCTPMNPVNSLETAPDIHAAPAI
jgi:FkbM family methyltransferase